ncbi:MAG: hypothetical protein V4494_06930, partial [Chlamydiota bacterium]
MEQQQSIYAKFIAAESCGNTFLIYEIPSRDDLKYIQNALIDRLKIEGRDSGLILQEIKPNIWQMFVVEKDGSISSFCGNGAKAVALYLLRYH